MIRYTIGRAISLCLSLIVASLVIFAVVEVVPGDPAAYMLGVNARPDTVAALRAVGLGCDIIGGAGTGSWPLEGGSGVYNELQCGSYAFMDADYGRVLPAIHVLDAVLH